MNYDSSNQTIISSLYYPGYSPKHKFTHNAFLNDLEEFIKTEMCNSVNVVAGDYNIHVEEREKTILYANEIQ